MYLYRYIYFRENKFGIIIIASTSIYIYRYTQLLYLRFVIQFFHQIFPRALLSRIFPHPPVTTKRENPSIYFSRFNNNFSLVPPGRWKNTHPLHTYVYTRISCNVLISLSFIRAFLFKSNDSLVILKQRIGIREKVIII